MPKTLLLADDSVVIQKLVGLSFANEDVELVTTDNGDDALKRAREIHPDLVLADVVMPGKNGYEVCQAIKEDPSINTTPVLLLTGTFEAFDEDRARQVGSDGHITKPFEAQGLVDRVTDLLSRPRPAPKPIASPEAQSAAQPAAASAAQPAVPELPTAPAAEPDDAYDFFDDEVQELAAPEAPAVPAAAMAAPDDSFEFGEDLDALSLTSPGGDTSETLDTNFELDEDTPDDLTIAVVAETPIATPPPVPIDLDAPDATRVAMGETMITDDFGAMPASPPASAAQVASLDERLAEAAPATAVPAVPAAPTPVSDPAQTMLADDLFADPVSTEAAAPTPPPIPAPAAPEAATPATGELPPAMDSGFEFGFDDANPGSAEPVVAATAEIEEDLVDDESDPLAGMASPRAVASFEAEADADAPDLADAAGSTHSGYDVSASDLGNPLGDADGSPSLATPVAAAARSDLSPLMQERIHETLEKIAWEAFADVSDTIVRQVLQRVESIVWEVVPQMAEALIQEEIRRMKGEE